MKSDFNHLAPFRVPDPATMCYGGPRYGCFAVPYSRPFFFGKNPEYWIEAKAADDVCSWDTVDVMMRYREFATGHIKSQRPDWEDMIFVRNMFFDASETVHMYVPVKPGHDPHKLRLWTPGRAMAEVETPYSRKPVLESEVTNESNA